MHDKKSRSNGSNFGPVFFNHTNVDSICVND